MPRRCLSLLANPRKPLTSARGALVSFGAADDFFERFFLHFLKTQKEIIDTEQENAGYINLHLEGTFYKAYEQFALLRIPGSRPLLKLPTLQISSASRINPFPVHPD